MVESFSVNSFNINKMKEVLMVVNSHNNKGRDFSYEKVIMSIKRKKF